MLYNIKNYLSLGLLFLSMATFAQNEEYTVIKSRKFVEPFVETQLVASVEDQAGGVYTVRYYDEYVSMKHHHSNSTGFIVQHWDSLQQSISYNNYKIETGKKGVISGFTIVDEKLHVLEYEKNRRDKTMDCFIHKPIDYTNALNREKIFSIDIKKFPNFIIPALSDNLDSNYYGNMEFSENGKYVAFHMDSYTNDSEAHKIFVFNSDFEMVWEKEFNHSEKDRLFDIRQVEVDNQGDVYILGKVYHNRRQNIVKKKVNYHYEVFKVNENVTEQTYLNLLGRFAHTMSLVLQEGQVSCIGIYSEKSDLNIVELFSGKDEYEISGTLFFSINKDNMKIRNTLFQEFPSEFKDFKYEDGKEKGYSKYYLNRVSSLPDGGFIFSVHENHVVITSGYNGAPVEALVDNDLIVFRLGELGSLVWAKNINRSLGASNIKLTMHSSFVNNENTYVLLNELKNVKPIGGNLNFKRNNLVGVTEKNSNLYMVKLDGNGNIFCEALHLNRYNDIMFYPVNGKAVYNSQMVIFGSNEKQKQFLSFKLN